MIASRIPLAFASGLLLSFAIFLGLWHLVDAQFDIGPRIEATVLEFTPQIADTPTETKRQPKPQREPPTLEPRPGIKGPGDPTIVDDFAFQRTVALPVERGNGQPLGGSVRDATVVASEPGTVFDAAVARWPYNPRIDRDVAVERVGLQALIRFEFDD